MVSLHTRTHLYVCVCVRVCVCVCACLYMYIYVYAAISILAAHLDGVAALVRTRGTAISQLLPPGIILMP